ncbi:hypothetical protein OHV52_18530 [Acinetobacter baumannii]|uniref:phosphoribosyltransferase-like protein n=1 Tax=Acinetobacter baumannii TaxID=470 RepID=UPI001D197BB9|nr:hypothetical protein [Acinetobacter baumannii]MDC4527847.1 hypothetical protein [Acinetobacter baumannii]
MNILTDQKFEEYRQKILNLNQYAWDNDKPWDEVEQWLLNFKGYSFFPIEKEKIYALHMLSNFNYFSQDMVRQMLKSCFEELLIIPLKQQIRKKHSDTLDIDLINRELAQELKQTIFIGAGNPSESGTHLLYYFRQMNQLPTTNFLDFHGAFIEDAYGNISIRDPDIKRFIFFDDLVATGEQLNKFTIERVKKIRQSNPDIDIRFMSMFATTKALKKINTKESFNGGAKALFILDESYKAFGKKSRYFKRRKWPSKYKLKMFSGRYSQLLVAERNKHGFNASQLMIGFSYNTPDNSLPIFWKEADNFNPIFKRFHKNGPSL